MANHEIFNTVVNTMWNTLLSFVFVFILIPGISTSAEQRTLEIEFSLAAPNYPDKHLVGYRLYKENEQVCQTENPEATTITCDFLTEDGTFDFTLTACFSDDTESPPSPTFQYTIGSVTPPDPIPDTLQAVITPTPSSGEAPLNISFSVTGSTGNISSYFWEFGDGTNSTGSSASHIYSIPGTYSATLRVKYESGATDLATASITALPNTTPPGTPTAALASSTAAGNAPLTITFNGTSSTTPNPPITSYSWSFGDGSQDITTGETASHTYSTAGTYRAQLIVTDSLGQIDQIDTPIIVVGTVAPNKKPIAVISTDPIEGNVPLSLSFDGSQSSDPDGSIVRYDWNFGDGTMGTGPSVQHTYTDAALYTMSLQVIDNIGGTATITREIICNTVAPGTIPTFEVGEISIDHKWVNVLFENKFNHPVVIAGPPTFNGSKPVLMRIRNINQEGFEIRLQEWDYLEDNHIEETFSYIVMEKGAYTLDSGIKIEAGSFTGSSRRQKISLQQKYRTPPVLLTQIISEDDPGAVTGRISKIKRTSFKYLMQEQQTTRTSHTPETIGYIAWEPGIGEISGLIFETRKTRKKVKHKWYNLTFKTEFPDLPLFIADMQTYKNRDTAAVRAHDLSRTSTQIKVEEEQSKDNEIKHKKEVIGYLVIGSATAEAE